MPGFDLTDFSGATKVPSPVKAMKPVSSHEEFDEDENIPETNLDRERLSEDSIRVGDHVVKTRGSVSKQQLEKTAWTPDKFAQEAQKAKEEGKSMEGILYAGEEDEAHKEFLKNTTYVD